MASYQGQVVYSLKYAKEAKELAKTDEQRLAMTRVIRCLEQATELAPKFKGRAPQAGD